MTVSALVALVVALAHGPTTANAASFTYDTNTIARFAVLEFGVADASPAQPIDAREGSVSRSADAPGTSTTRLPRSVATEAVSTPEVTLDGARYPESAAHAQDAIGGNSAEYTIDRAGAAARRAAAMEGQPRIPGMDRDEWPPDERRRWVGVFRTEGDVDLVVLHPDPEHTFAEDE